MSASTRRIQVRLAAVKVDAVSGLAWQGVERFFLASRPRFCCAGKRGHPWPSNRFRYMFLFWNITPNQGKLVPPSRMLACVLSFAATFLAAPSPHAAGSYPTHPITLVLAYPPGGGTDYVARLLARELDKSLGVNVVVENRPGGASVIGTSVVARAAPDGYTLLLADPAYATNPSLMRHLPYDPQSLTPVATVTVSPLVLAVPASSAIKSLDTLVAAGRQNRDGVTFASAGLGSSPHLAGELLKLRTHANFVHVPYKGSGPAMTDLIGGRIDFAFATLPAASQYILKGQLRGLATTGDARSKLLPDLPTVSETIPDFRVNFWTALMAPRGTPPELLAKLNAAVKTALQSPAMSSGLEQAGENPTYMTQVETAAFIAGENSKWAKVITEGNILVQ